MKYRYGAVFLIVLILVGNAFIIDLPGSQSIEVSGVNSISTNGFFPLKMCEPASQSFEGQLVPSDDNLNPERSLSEVAVGEQLPMGSLSTRVGFGISAATDPEYWAGMLGSGWYIDWQVQPGTSVGGLEHWQMIRVHDNCIFPSSQEIQQAAVRNPGQVWVIGNEPDVIWQDNITPEKYAFFYHQLYFLIKASDPTALIAVGGISQSTPLRLDYLDRVLEAYQRLYHQPMPVDWWTVHGYVLREQKDSWGVEIPPGFEVTRGELYEISDHGRLDLFASQLISFRRWMAEHGYRHNPLALTEFGILMPASYGFPPGTVADYLEATFTWLYQSQDSSIGYPGDGYHLVQKWAWFSISDPAYSSSDLGYLSSNELTLIGERFRNIVFSMETR